MSSIMRARNGLTGRSDVSEVIGALSRAEGLDLRCSGLDAPTVTRYRASPRQNTLTPTVAPSRASGFVLRRNLALRHGIREGRQSIPAAVILRIHGRTVGFGSTAEIVSLGERVSLAPKSRP